METGSQRISIQKGLDYKIDTFHIGKKNNNNPTNNSATAKDMPN